MDQHSEIRGFNLLDDRAGILACPVIWYTCRVADGRWVRLVVAVSAGVEQSIFAVDGKTARRSHDHKYGQGALNSVSVWASGFGLLLGQVAIVRAYPVARQGPTFPFSSAR